MGKKRRMSAKLERVEDMVVPKAKLVKKSVCSCGFLLSCIKTVCLILFYYCFSISLTFYNQRFIHVIISCNFLSRLVYQPKNLIQSCFVRCCCHCHLRTALLATVCHRNVNIWYKYAHMYLVYMHHIFSNSD